MMGTMSGFASVIAYPSVSPGAKVPQRSPRGHRSSASSGSSSWPPDLFARVSTDTAFDKLLKVAFAVSDRTTVADKRRPPSAAPPRFQRGFLHVKYLRRLLSSDHDHNLLSLSRPMFEDGSRIPHVFDSVKHNILKLLINWH